MLVGTPPLILIALRFRRKLLPAYAFAAIIGAAIGSLLFWYTWAITGRFTFS